MTRQPELQGRAQQKMRLARTTESAAMTSTTGQTTTSVPGSAAADEAGEPGLERRPRLAPPVVPLPPNAPFLALQWQAIGAGAVTATQAQASSPERARHAFD